MGHDIYIELNKLLQTLIEEGDLTEKDINEFVQEIKNPSLKNKLKSSISRLDNSYKQLSENNRIFNTLLKNLPGFLYRCKNNKNWEFLLVSDEVLSVTGYKKEEFLEKKSITLGDIISKEHRDQVWEKVQEGVKNRSTFKLVYKIIKKDGTERWVWEQGTPIYDIEKGFLYLEGYITDITDRITLEGKIEEDKKVIDKLNDFIVKRELKMVELKKELKTINNNVTSTP